MSSPILASKFDSKKLTVSDPKKLDNGSQQVYVNYDGGRVRVQSPQLSVPYDSGDYQSNEKYKAQLSMKGRDSNPKVAAFYNMVEAIDNFVIDAATKNAGKWLKMPGASREMIAAFYTPSLKFSKDKATGEIRTEYPPTFAVALKKRNGEFDATIFDDKGAELEGQTPLDALRRGAEVIAVCDVTGIWIADKKFGLTWKLHQAQVKVAGEGAGAKGFCAVDEDGEALVASTTGVSAREEASVLAAVLPVVAKKTAAAPAPAPAAALVTHDDEDEEDDDEGDEDDEEEDDAAHVTPAPAVPVAKSAVKVAAPAPAPAPAPAATTKPAGTKVVRKPGTTKA
jgi:hypothetical protein